MSGTGIPFANPYGPFHRKMSPTQDSSIAAEQERSWALLGRAARWSPWLSVKAYRGPLSSGEQGIEFVTLAKPSAGTHPHDVFWLEGDPDVWNVEHNHDRFAMIVARVTKRVYNSP